MPRWSFRTDASGTPPKRLVLFPDTEYSADRLRRRVEDRLKDKSELASWVRDAVIGDLETLVLGIRARPAGCGRGGGNFLLLGGCLMALEYLATVYCTGNGPEARVKAYASRFLVPVDAKYADCWGVLWRASRNGILHGSWPSRVATEGEPKEYKFAVGYETGHLHMVRTSDVLWVNPIQLLTDITASVERPAGFLDWIAHESTEDALARGQPWVIDIQSGSLEPWPFDETS